MKRLLFIILLFSSVLIHGQDPSFSQFDLNILYSNPAFSGYEGANKILLHSRNQWNHMDENFNNSILEISTNIKLNDNNRKTKTSWAPGLNIISEDIGIPELGNTIFINKIEASMINALHLKLRKNFYLSGGF